MKKYKYFYIYGQRISKKQFNDLEKRYGMHGDYIKEGKTTIAYRREVPQTERDIVYCTGKY